ncbi:hypothetical protein [Streptomyces chrestomyceticus]
MAGVQQDLLPRAVAEGHRAQVDEQDGAGLGEVLQMGAAGGDGST